MKKEATLFMLQRSLHQDLRFAVGLGGTRILGETGGFSLLSSSRTVPTALSRSSLSLCVTPQVFSRVN
jgi:hypothetical protein